MNSSIISIINAETRPPVANASGKVVGVNGPLVLATLPGAGIGSAAFIKTSSGRKITAEIAGFRDSSVQLSPVDDINGIAYGDLVETFNTPLSVKIPADCLGMLLNSSGQILESKRESRTVSLNVNCPPPAPTSRTLVNVSLPTGIAAIDTFTPVARGQRLVVKAPAGIGKTSLVANLAKNTTADVCVVGLVGERGREVGEFFNHTLSINAKQRTVVIASTSDEPPAKRKMAASVATAIAEYYRDQGLSVLLVIDSLTRYARAIREVGLSLGELPVRHGYTPSVYTELPKLLERSGNSAKGSITAFYTLLTGSDDESDPLAEEVTSIVDGHILLTSKLFQLGYRPAMDVTRSLSRCKDQVSDPDNEELRKTSVQLLSKLYRERELLIFGGQIDSELSLAFKLEKRLQFHFNKNSSVDDIFDDLRELLASISGNFE